METTDSNEFHIKVSAISNTATIFLCGRFAFHAHRDFKAAYKVQLDNEQINRIVIDFSEVQYLDSSALGMLLVLRDHVRDANKSLVLTKPNTITERTFDIAGFHKMFTIN